MEDRSAPAARGRRGYPTPAKAADDDDEEEDVDDDENEDDDDDDEDEGSEDDDEEEEEEEEEDNQPRVLPQRATRGNRIRKLMDEGETADEFWDNVKQFFEEGEQDSDFEAEGKTQECVWIWCLIESR